MPLIDNTQSATDLVNLSLGMLGLDDIDSIEGTDKISIKVRRAYVSARNSLLRLRAWNCAIARQALNAITNPSTEFAYCFQLPTDPAFVRAIGFESANKKYVIEGRTILTDELNPTLVYVALVDAHMLDSMLFEVLVTKVASSLAGTLLKDAKMQMTLAQVASGLIDDAAGVDDAERGESKGIDLTKNR